MATGTTINEATQAYNDGKPQEALKIYQSALAAPTGEQQRTLNGIYLASWKLGRTQEAEIAFGRIVAWGIANKTLGVKLLFNLNSTDFWSDPKVSGPYPIWLSQIARQIAQAKVCMDIVGHTSRLGSEACNDRLSAQRAAAIRQRLGSEAAELNTRTKTCGVGFRENIGTGTDVRPMRWTGGWSSGLGGVERGDDFSAHQPICYKNCVAIKTVKASGKKQVPRDF